MYRMLAKSSCPIALITPCTSTTNAASQGWSSQVYLLRQLHSKCWWRLLLCFGIVGDRMLNQLCDITISNLTAAVLRYCIARRCNSSTTSGRLNTSGDVIITRSMNRETDRQKKTGREQNTEISAPPKLANLFQLSRDQNWPCADLKSNSSTLHVCKYQEALWKMILTTGHDHSEVGAASDNPSLTSDKEEHVIYKIIFQNLWHLLLCSLTAMTKGGPDTGGNAL